MGPGGAQTARSPLSATPHRDELSQTIPCAAGPAWAPLSCQAAARLFIVRCEGDCRRDRRRRGFGCPFGAERAATALCRDGDVGRRPRSGASAGRLLAGLQRCPRRRYRTHSCGRTRLSKRDGRRRRRGGLRTLPGQVAGAASPPPEGVQHANSHKSKVKFCSSRRIGERASNASIVRARSMSWGMTSAATALRASAALAAGADRQRTQIVSPSLPAAPGARELLSLYIEHRQGGGATAWLSWFDTRNNGSFCHFQMSEWTDASLDARVNECFRAIQAAAAREALFAPQAQPHPERVPAPN